MSDPLMNKAPGACKNPKLFEDTWIDKPYGGVSENSIVVRSMFADFEPLINSLSKEIPPDGIGFASADEYDWRDSLLDRARVLRFAQVPGKSGETMREFAQRAYQILTRDVGDYHYRMPFDSPNLPGEHLANENFRAEIREAYQDAIELLWCAEVLFAEHESFSSNKKSAQEKTTGATQTLGPLLKPMTATLAPTLQTTTTPTATASIAPDEDDTETSPEGDDSETSPSATTSPSPSPSSSSKSMGPLLIVGLLGVAGIGFALMRKK